MFQPTRSQLLLIAAIVIGLIVGRLIKNFKIGMILAIVIGTLMVVQIKKK